MRRSLPPKENYPMLEDPELFAAIEAMLFVSGEPVALPDMARAVSEPLSHF